jgi:hypothetical protein
LKMIFLNPFQNQPMKLIRAPSALPYIPHRAATTRDPRVNWPHASVAR